MSEDNVIRIDLCDKEHKDNQAGNYQHCCAKCPFCNLNIKLQFFAKHIMSCRRKFPNKTFAQKRKGP